MAVRHGQDHPAGPERDAEVRPAPPRATRRSLFKACKARIQSLAFALAPGAALVLFSMYDRRWIESQVASLGLADLARRIEAHTGSTVQRGPFAGMKLDVKALPVHVTPKLVGTYEAELHEVIEEALARAPRTIVNIGCAEGYYAIGIARRLPHAIVHAHDADWKARKATRLNATLNRVDRNVQTGGR
jgi:hypothetical protein